MKELEYPFDLDYILTKKRKIKKELLNQHISFVNKKIAILGGSTTNNIKVILELFLLNNGIYPEFYESEYNQYYEDAVFSNECLNNFKPDIVYICTTVRNIKAFPQIRDSKEAIEELISSEIKRYKLIWESLYKRFKCAIIQNNFELPIYRLLGNFSAVDEHGIVNYIMRLNMLFSEEISKRTYLHLCDLNFIAADYGLKKWHDNKVWYMYKYAMCLEAIPELVFNVANIIKAILGKNKKAFVLDLDNTLWGGVIGDDGIENIILGQESSLGQAYMDFQRYIKEYKQLGILLCIDSKNEMNNALLGLKHPDSILHEEDFISIKANWDSKDINLIQISNELSLMPDSFVFIDDNSAERMIISENIPGVAVPDIDRITEYIRIIDYSGFFEVISISQDDTKRNEMYKENMSRVKMALAYEDYNEYLKKLEMKAIISRFKDIYMARIVQLTNKSNQFNLTTRRYTLEELESVAISPEYITMYGRLKDKFGDNGIVSVVVGHIEKNTCIIELWLMSCRVLKRDMEFAMMDEFVKECKVRNIKMIKGIYIPTEKNQMVSDFYERMGFTLESNNEAGGGYIVGIRET